MELKILIFWIAIYGAIWLLRRNPKNLLSRAAFTWMGPVPIVEESWSRFQFRWASYSFGWLCQFSIALFATFVVKRYFAANGDEDWFLVVLFALPLGIGVAALAMVGFLVKAGKARWFGPNPSYVEPQGPENDWD